MAQLSDDCFAFGGPLLSIDDVERLLSERVKPVSRVEDVRLIEADGRVLATDIEAPISLPPFDNSAVDGYAVRHADLAPDSETRVVVVDRTQAGYALARPVGHREAVRIFTGARMPAGADTVFMQEDCRTEDTAVFLPSGLKPGANRRLTGEDVAAGSIVLRAKQRLAPQHIAIGAAVGITRVPVRRRIRVALFSTGDEVLESGSHRPPAAIYDANRPLLTMLARRLGAEVTDLGILKDDLAVLRSSIATAAEAHDVVMTTGGVSTGEADLVRAAVEAVGQIVFWRLAIKPGRPMAIGTIAAGKKDDTAVFAGLPGNPVAAFVTFARVVRPLILRLAGAAPERLVPLPVRSTFPYRKKRGRREYVRVSLRRGNDGTIEAHKYPQDGAGVLSSLTETDGLAELLEETTAVTPGQSIGFLPYQMLIG
jgi:molybdopterin molybdotransferase